MPSCKILILNSSSNGQGRDLKDLILQNRQWDVQIGNWDNLPLGPLDFILPVMPPDKETWKSIIGRLTHHYPEGMILPVLTQDLIPTDISSVFHFGAADYITPPFREIEVIPRIERHLGRPSLDDIQTAKKTLMERRGLKKMIGKSPSFLRLSNQIPTIAKSGVDVLIQGETGTGKELFARAIHYLSERAPYPFMAINSATIPSMLFENELFGHLKEAFTGAKSSQPGKIRAAEGGSLFLDEVDSLDVVGQAKLLRFIEEREYMPLGSGKTVKADVRIIAAANTDLLKNVEEDRFRRDLYYRMSVITLTLPPLRSRPEDILILAEHFLKKYEPRFGQKHFSSEARNLLCQYSWPGNIRELENIVQQAMILSPGPSIEPKLLPVQTQGTTSKSPIHPADAPTFFNAAKREAVQSFEKEYLIKMLKLHEGNITQAARAAGKDRRVFGRLIKRHGLT